MNLQRSKTSYNLYPLHHKTTDAHNASQDVQDTSRKNHLIVVESKVKLANRPIVWKEAYTKKTLFLKKQFHDIIGPGSYFRYEGHDSDTGDNYFVVVGPAKVHSPKSEYFAGVRKLPANYAAGGKYFHDMKEAAEYANETWGIPIPSSMRYYDSSDLKNIGAKVKKWKEHQDEDDGRRFFYRH